jgi:hypothetical protein
VADLTVDELHEIRAALYDRKFETERNLQSTAPARDVMHDECCDTAKSRAAYRAQDHAAFKTRYATIMGALAVVEAALPKEPTRA